MVVINSEKYITQLNITKKALAMFNLWIPTTTCAPFYTPEALYYDTLRQCDTYLCYLNIYLLILEERMRELQYKITSGRLYQLNALLTCNGRTITSEFLKQLNF